MHTLKRWRIGLFSKVDEVVARVENHEALVESAILDLRKEVVVARVQLNRVRKDGQQMAENQKEALRNAQSWKERAARTLDDDKAMACLRRAKQADNRLRELGTRIMAHGEVETKLTRTLTDLEHKMELLRERRNVLKSRETSANAMKLAGGATAAFGGDVEEMLSRWESKIEGTAYCLEGIPSDVDSLENEFLHQEEEDDLRAELDALRRQENG
ncbi:MAG: PspA/IM30 family protein [Deltaproteobacteria bacterium]|nr:PspA/IM30 family protein [Deltaproteobacteria bacterium]